MFSGYQSDYSPGNIASQIFDPGPAAARSGARKWGASRSSAVWSANLLVITQSRRVVSRGTQTRRKETCVPGDYVPPMARTVKSSYAT